MAGELRGFLARSRRESGRVIIVVMGAALAVLALAFVTAHLRGVPLDDMTVDFTSTERGGRLGGVISSLGVVLWASAGAVALFASWSLTPGIGRTMLRVLGLSSLALGADDHLMIHEEVSAALPGGDVLVALVYAGTGIGVVVAGRTWFRGSHEAVLLLAGAAFATSLGLDAIAGSGPVRDELQTVVEDSFKFVGVALWAAYLWLRAREEIALSQAHTRVLEQVMDQATPGARGSVDRDLTPEMPPAELLPETVARREPSRARVKRADRA